MPAKKDVGKKRAGESEAGADLYSTLLKAALVDEDIRQGLSSGDDTKIKKAIGAAVGQGQVTNERVAAIKEIQPSDWVSIEAVAVAFGNNQALN